MFVVNGNPKKIEGLEIGEFEDAFMVQQPDQERVHYVNHTALLVLELCTGESSVSEIAESVRSAYELDEAPLKEVEQILRSMIDEGLVEVQGSENG